MPNNKEKLREMEALMQTLEIEPEHVLQVRRLAVALFEQLSSIHHVGSDQLLLLEGAALLHDIGHTEAEEGKKHHKLSAELILSNSWETLSKNEAALIACVARYHRRSLPSLEHEEFASLAPPERALVEKLAALLRIADGLDRSHLQPVKAIRAAIEPKKVILSVESSDDVSIECEAAVKKSDLFEKIFGLALFVTPRG